MPPYCPRAPTLTPMRCACQGIDQLLKQACEDVIKTAADAVSGSTYSWAERLRMVYSLDNEPLPQKEGDLPRMNYELERHWAGADSAVGIINTIPYSLEHDTNEVVVRLRCTLRTSGPSRSS